MKQKRDQARAPERRGAPRKIRSNLGVHFHAVVTRVGILHGHEADRPAAHGAVLHVILVLAAAGVDERLERLSTMRAR